MKGFAKITPVKVVVGVVVVAGILAVVALTTSSEKPKSKFELGSTEIVTDNHVSIRFTYSIDNSTEAVLVDPWGRRFGPVILTPDENRAEIQMAPDGTTPFAGTYRIVLGSVSDPIGSIV